MAGRNMTLDVLVRLRDLLSGPLRGLKNNLAGLANFARKIGVLGAAIGALSFLGPIQEAAAFQQKLLDIAGTAELSGRAAFAFVDETQAKYEALALKIGQVSATVADGAGQMIAAGVDAGMISRNIETIGKSATSANSEFADMAGVATSLLKTLAVPETELEGALAGLVVAGKQGAFELKDMARYFPQLTGHMRKFGIVGREASDQIASMLQIAKMGTADPSQAATNLNNFLSKALAPVTQKNFKDLGVDIEAVMMDAAAKGINPIEAMLQKIGKLTGVSTDVIGSYMARAKKNGLEGADALAFVREQLESIGAAGKLGELFGDQQVLDFLLPMMANLEEYKRIKSEVGAATGAVIDADFETQMAGINRQLITLREIGTQAVRMTGMAFAEWLPAINGWLMEALRWVRELDQSSGGMVKRLLSFSGAGLLAVSALGTLGIVLPIVGAGLSAMLALLGVILSPIGLFVAAIAGGAAFIWKNWDRYGERVMRLWERGKRAFQSFGEGIVRRGRDIAAGFRPFIAGISDSLAGLMDPIRRAGGALADIGRDIAAIVMAVPKEDIDWNWLGQLAGMGLGTAAADLNRLAADLAAILKAGSGVTAWLKGADPNSWTGVITQATVTTVTNMVNPLGAVATHTKALVSALSGASPDAWSNLIPAGAWKIIDDMLHPLSSLVEKVQLLITGLEKIANFKWPSFGGVEAPADPSLTNADRITERENYWRQFHGVPFEGGMHRAGRGAGPQPGGGVPSAPVRLDGNVNVTIKVDGGGKVTSASSDNPQITVGKGGRAVGRV